MAKKHKKAITRAERQSQRARDLAKQQAQEEELQEEILPEEVIPEAEAVEKDMGMGDYYMGATSWQEKDELKAAQEQAANVRQVTYETEELVWNILNHPMKDPKEKAQAIQAVASGFEERVSKVAKIIKKDLDVLVIESILAYDKRHSSPLEFIGNLISKAKSTANLSDENFALVKEDSRTFPIHDKTHVRESLARAAQMISKGGDEAADARQALPAIREAAKGLGIEVSMEKDTNAILIEKDANGDWRWIGWVTNKFIDWDEDILAEDAHKEYVDWLEKNPDFYPVSTTWHAPEGIRKNAVDFAAYESGFLIMSGKLEEDEAEALLKAKALTDLGMSHGTFVLARDPKDPRIITKYRMYEVSDLPLDNAANPFTNFEVLTKEADMKKEEYLATILGPEKAKAFLEKTGLKKEALEAAGIESKEKQDAPAEPPATPETPAATAQAPAVDMEAIIKAVGEKYGMEQLSTFLAELQEKAEKVEVLEELVKDLQQEPEEKLVQMLTPPAERLTWMVKNRASQADETVVEGEEETTLKSKTPGVPAGYWLSEATGTAPVQAQ